MKSIKSQFRLRGFVCPNCKEEMQVFGNHEAPAVCSHCNMVLLNPEPAYDQLVTTVKTIEPLNGKSE
jgi:ribosomal protein S27E